MTSFYKYLLPIFCFACVSATATPTKTKPQTPTNANIVPASYIVKPDFKVDNSAFPSCDCDEQGTPLASCQEKTIQASATFVVDVDGTVKNATLTKSTGSKQADVRILRKLTQTKFNPALQDNQPIKMRIHQPIFVVYVPHKNAMTCETEKSNVKTSHLLMALPVLLKK